MPAECLLRGYASQRPLAQVQPVRNPARRLLCRGVNPPDGHAGARRVLHNLLSAAAAATRFAVPHCQQQIGMAHHVVAQCLIRLPRKQVAARPPGIVPRPIQHHLAVSARQQSAKFLEVLLGA